MHQEDTPGKISRGAGEKPLVHMKYIALLNKNRFKLFNML